MMLKKILIGGLVAVVVVAAAFSIYNTTLAARQDPQAQISAAGTTQGFGQGYGQASGQANGGQGNGQGGQSHGNQNAAGDQTGIPDPQPQNGLTEWVSYTGMVSAYAAPKFTLLTDDGQSIPAEVGNSRYANELGLVLQDGDRVSVVGFWDAGGGLALKSLTLEASGETFNFRDDLGRPLWAGGRGQGNSSHP
jgi:hypothetical protein